MIARTANDPAILSTANTSYEAPLATGGGFPASFDLVSGVRYAIGLIVVGAAPLPTVRGYESSVAFAALAPVLGRALTGQTDLPASVPASTPAAAVVPWLAAGS